MFFAFTEIAALYYHTKGSEQEELAIGALWLELALAPIKLVNQSLNRELLISNF